ncbi:MAG: hypothetical protein KDA64_13335 [Rhodospirillaceae bacterium]|nr:hypothetical protein [Rhodospirillaceae bacterium]
MCATQPDAGSPASSPDAPPPDAPSRRGTYRWQREVPPGWRDLLAGGKRAKRWRRYWIADVVDGLGDIAGSGLMRLGPVEAVSNLGGRLGRRAGAKVHLHGTEVARTALRHLRPDLPREAEDAWLAGMWENIGRTFAETALLSRIHDQGRLQGGAAEHFQQALKDGVPAIALFAHVGNWELAYGWLPRHGVPLSFAYQPPDNRFRHWVIKRTRQRQGAEILPPDLRSLRPLLDRLRAGRAVGFAVDEAIEDYCYGPAFGRPLDPAGNIAVVQVLAHLAGARIIPGYCLRRPGVRFDVEIGAPLIDFSRNRPDRLTRAHIAEGAAVINAHFEPVIHANLQQWFMLHQFGIREGEAPRFTPPAA